MNREAAIQILLAQGLSGNLAESCVDAAGNIDQSQVEFAKQAMAWARSPASHSNPALVSNLIGELKAATGRRDVTAMMRVRSALARQGIFNPEL